MPQVFSLPFKDRAAHPLAGVTVLQIIPGLEVKPHGARGDRSRGGAWRGGGARARCLCRAAVKAVVDAAGERPRPAATPVSASVVGTNRAIGFAVGGTKRPRLSADDGDLARLVGQTWEVIHASNEPPWLFRSGGLPTWTVRDDDGFATAKPLTEDRLRHTLAQLADWRRSTKKDGYVPAHPPAAVVKSILSTPDPSLPVLAGITTTPVFGLGGELLKNPATTPMRAFSTIRRPASSSRLYRRRRMP